MDSLTLTQTEALAAGGILGGMLASIGIFALAVYILAIVAWWKIFTKAGEKGWKSLIPIYNIYVFCRIININFWIYILLIPFIIGLLGGLVFGSGSTAASVISGLYSLCLDIYLAIMLGRAFNKGTGFKIGLVLLPTIFYLILAFGESKYHGAKK